MSISPIQINHLIRCAKQYVFRNPVGVIGGYHGGNLGDMALGTAVQQILELQGIQSGLQTIYNLDKWVKKPFAIVGGGAIGYTDSLAQLVQRYKGNYDRLAFLGVDFNEEGYPPECIDLIQKAAFVSARSKAQADRLIQLTGRESISYHPDIAFSLFSDYCKQKREIRRSTTPKKLLLNVSLLYAQLQNNTILPNKNYKVERPDLYTNFHIMQQSYNRVIRLIVDRALQEGYTVETIPFSPLDAIFGRIILDRLPVQHTAYHSDPLRMLKMIATADWVVATRFHATIFALKLGVNITPIAYATKNELMLEELGIKRSAFLSAGDLANGIDQELSPIEIDSTKITQWEEHSQQAIMGCINAIQIQ